MARKKNDIKKLEKKLEQGENMIEDYVEYHNANFDEGKQPNLILVFNSTRGQLEIPGFSPLGKEIAEILESGRIQDFKPINYIERIERYASIEQRWGK